MKKLTFIISTCIMSCGLNICSKAALHRYDICAESIPLGEIHFSSGGGGNVLLTKLGFAWEVMYPPYEEKYHKLEWGFFSPSDIGKTIMHSASTSSEFDYYATMLTSGTDDFLCIGVEHPGEHIVAETGMTERLWFDKFVETQAADFYGYKITGIVLTVNKLTLDYPSTEWTDYSYDITYTVYGIPEPASLLMFGLSAAIMIRKKC